MKRHLQACTMITVFCLALPVMGATRILSLYVESFAAFQRQLFQAAELFEAPELGMAPMMLSMSIPGVAEIDREQPIGLHMYAQEGADEPALVLEVSAASSVEALLVALLAARGEQTLPEAVDGRYVTANVVAQADGKRVLLANSEADLELALQDTLPSSLPAVPGVIRLTTMPAKLGGLLDQAQAVMQATTAQTPQQQAFMSELLTLYRLGLEQIATYEQGLGISAKGLEIRSRVLPVAGRATESIIASLQPVPEEWISEVAGDALFGVVAGAYHVPEDVLQRVLDRYLSMFSHVGAEMSMDMDLMRNLMEPSLATVGTPSFFFANVKEDLSRLWYFGGAAYSGAPALLSSMLEWHASEAYVEHMKQSGMVVSAPETRTVADTTVYRWNVDVDEEQFQQKIEKAGGAAGTLDIETMQKILSFFMSGYDYAATDQGLAFAAGGEAAPIGRALDLLAGRQKVAASKGAALMAMLEPPVAPYGIGRFDLFGLMSLSGKLGNQAPIALPESGEGILFAGWQIDGVVEQVLLVPAADIKALSKAIRAATQGLF